MQAPMFSKSHKPIFVGSYLRNTGCGNRIHVVSAIKGNVVTLVTYGSTNKGNFKPAKRHRFITGTLSKCYTGNCSTNCIVSVQGTMVNWWYTHVIRN